MGGVDADTDEGHNLKWLVGRRVFQGGGRIVVRSHSLIDEVYVGGSNRAWSVVRRICHPGRVPSSDWRSRDVPCCLHRFPAVKWK